MNSDGSHTAGDSPTEAGDRSESWIERRADLLARFPPTRAFGMRDDGGGVQEPIEIARLRRLFKCAPGFIAILRGPAHVYEFVNDAYVNLLGVRAYLGRPLREVVPEFATQGFIQILDHVLSSGRRFVARRNALWVAPVGEQPMRRRVLDFVCEPMTDPQNRIIGIFVEGFDVTAEGGITEHSVVGGRYWEICPDLLGLVKADGYFRQTNPAWQTRLGWSADEVAATSLYDLLHPDDRVRTHQAFEVLQINNAVSRFENRYRCRDGAYRWLAWSAVAFEDAYFACGRDITAEKDSAAALALAEEALRQSQKMEAVGQLTGGIAHDFNNLLTGICGSLELLAVDSADTTDTDRQQLIASTRAAAGRAASLTQRLLAFSRRQPSHAVPVDVNCLVTGMYDLVQRTVGPRVAVWTDLAPDLWSILVDANQLENALLNLCINGRDALPQGGGLQIETRNVTFDECRTHPGDLLRGQYVCMSVKDAGTGMSPDVVAHAGDAFFTTKPNGKGTGLGLSMLYGFAREANGDVRIDSEIGRGSTVSLFIPRHDGTAASVEARGRPDAAFRRGRGEIVLVVDDESTVRIMLREMLKRFGYASVEASDAAAGIELLQSLPRVDLLLTDVGLPGVLNGRQMADAARRLHPHLKVIFITGYAQTAVALDGRLDAGMEVLTKPFGMADLLERVDRLLNER